MRSNRPFRLVVKPEGIFLAVDGAAKEVVLAEVLAYIRSRDIQDYDADAVLRAVNEKPQDPVRIADRRDDLDRPAMIEVRPSDDGLKAELRITEPLGKPWPTVEACKAEMGRKGVSFGIDEGALRKTIEDRRAGEWVGVARGVAPVDGKDAEFIFKVDLEPARPKAVDDSRVDMKDLGTVVNVIKGQELLEKKPAVISQDGTSVFGKTLKARLAKDKNIPAGTNTVISDDGLHLFSVIDGCVKIKDNRVCVLPVFEVSGDVDYGTGNIQFVGDVVVKGTIREGFEVSAGGGITVGGVVEGATVACEGDMVVRGGLRGMGKARVQVKGNLSATYVDQAWVRCGRDLVVADVIMHSDVGARGTVSTITGKKGIIVGGKIQAGCEIRCEVLGNEMGTRTEVVVGIPPEILEEKSQLQQNQKELEGKLGEIVSNVGYLKKIEALGRLDDQKREVLLKLTRAQFQLQAQLGVIKDKLAALEVDMDRNRTEGRVSVHRSVYPGVAVTIRGVTYLVRDKMDFISFMYIDGEVKPRPFQ